MRESVCIRLIFQMLRPRVIRRHIRRRRREHTETDSDTHTHAPARGGWKKRDRDRHIRVLVPYPFWLKVHVRLLRRYKPQSAVNWSTL